LFDFIVVAEVREYFVASIPQHLALLLNDDVLTARVLIPVVYDEDFHWWRDSLPDARRTRSSPRVAVRCLPRFRLA